MKISLSQKSSLTSWIILLGTTISLIILVPFDYDWTVYLHENKWPWFAEFMRRTLFEGSAFGASDPAIILALSGIFGYFYIHRRQTNPKLLKYRPYFGFILSAGLVTGLGFVHSMKWIIGRARPHIVLNEELPFTDWYQFGPHFIADGIFFGSFPSGHVASVFTTMTIAYLLAGDRQHSLQTRSIGWIIGILTFVYAGAMGIGRAMSAHHWLTDSIAIIGMAWWGIHILYFRVLRIPEQYACYLTHETLPTFAKYWEFILCMISLMATIGIMAMILGVRAWFLANTPEMVLLTLPGACIFYYSFRKALSYYQSNIQMLSP